MKIKLTYWLITGFFLLQGCSQLVYLPMKLSDARIGAETPQYKELVSLPAPKEKIVAAVYKFRDQTGQYKEMEAGASWSTAVTQGATSILLRAMEESGWFIPIEREGLSNLLNERKIIRSSMSNYMDEDSNQSLPPLVFAGIILEGGIISFDSNIMTGGVGARYFGTGGSTQYREDRVTIYLRAVSTSNGRILKTVYTSKTILSQQVDVGVFRYVSTRRLLEAETGFTYNEPSEMAVKEAIEKAVYGLVVEGVLDGLWALNNETEIDSTFIEQYIAEKNTNREIDAFSNHLTDRRNFWSAGINGGAMLYEGDYSNSGLFASGGLSLEAFANKPISLGLNIGTGQVGSDNVFMATIGYADLGLKYRFMNNLRTTPYIRVGGGYAAEMVNTLNEKPDYFQYVYPQVSTEVGLEIMTKKRIGINGSLNYRWLFTDELDGIGVGKYDDTVWGVHLGVNYYFNNWKL